MSQQQYSIRAKVWLYPGMAGWHFVTLPKTHAQKIKKQYSKLRRGWGSLPVHVTMDTTKWKTSIFPDKKSGSYLLPLKAQIRKQKNIVVGKTIHFSIQIQV